MEDIKKNAPGTESEYLIEVKNLVKWFPIKSSFFRRTIGNVRAVDGISFHIKRGQTMGLVGESGCGKSTAGRTILRLIEKTSGEVIFDGQDIFKMSREELRKLRPRIQIIFQDPYSSLSPRIPVGEIIGEAVREHNIVPKEEFDDYISRIMRACGLQEYHKDRYPHEFSGGQRQRICIARALALNPDFIVCDEPVSALDVSIQAQIINLLKRLQKDFGFTYLFISHDLSVVEHISDTVGVMYLGSMVEYADTDKIFSHPLHPYTEALFSAIPIPDPDVKMKRIILKGSLPSPANPPKGCKFHTRCHKCMEVCKYAAPEWAEIEPEHWCACHLYDDEALGELERVVERISSENLVEAMEELDRRLGALTPDAPERERAALAEDSLAALAPVIACFDTANWLRPPTDREQFLDEIAFADYNEAQQDVYGRIERGIEAVMAERAQREKAAAAPSQFCARPCSSVSAWSWSWAPSKASSCRCTSLPRTAPSCSATCCRPCPPACSLARSATRRSPTSCAAAPGTSCRSPAWPWESWGWAFCRRSRCSSRARSCWVFRPAPSRPCSASSSSTAFPPKIEEAPSARRIRSPWPPRPWPCSPPRSSWRAQACPWPPWPSPAAGCSSPCGPSTPTA